MRFIFREDPIFTITARILNLSRMAVQFSPVPRQCSSYVFASVSLFAVEVRRNSRGISFRYRGGRDSRKSLRVLPALRIASPFPRNKRGGETVRHLDHLSVLSRGTMATSFGESRSCERLPSRKYAQ